MMHNQRFKHYSVARAQQQHSVFGSHGQTLRQEFGLCLAEVFYSATVTVGAFTVAQITRKS